MTCTGYVLCIIFAPLLAYAALAILCGLFLIVTVPWLLLLSLFGVTAATEALDKVLNR
jgi:hypothetical protein